MQDELLNELALRAFVEATLGFLALELTIRALRKAGRIDDQAVTRIVHDLRAMAAGIAGDDADTVAELERLALDRVSLMAERLGVEFKDS